MSLLSIISQFSTGAGGIIVPAQKRSNFMAEGDSLTATAEHGGVSPVWTEILRDQVSTDVIPYIENYGFSGMSVYNGMDTSEQINEVLTGIKYDVDFNILNLLCGINDIQGGMPGATVYEVLKDYFPKFKPYGLKTIAYCLTTCRSTVFDETKQEQIWLDVQALNALNRVGFQTDLKADVLIDLQTDPLFGGYDTPKTSPYFMPDYLHYSVAGKTQLVRYIRKAIEKINANEKGVITYANL